MNPKEFVEDEWAALNGWHRNITPAVSPDDLLNPGPRIVARFWARQGGPTLRCEDIERLKHGLSREDAALVEETVEQLHDDHRSSQRCHEGHEEVVSRMRKGLADADLADAMHGYPAKVTIDEVIQAALAVKAAGNVQRRGLMLRELLADPRTLAPPRTLRTGWGRFDRIHPFGALEAGTVSVLAAPPGCYKTMTGLRLARGFAEQGHAVCWLAAEMQPRTLVRRMLCQQARLGQAALASEAMPPDHAKRLAEAQASLDAIADRIEFMAAPIGFPELDRAAEGSAVVFLDYLQLVRHPEAEVRGAERIEGLMARVAEIAQRTGTAFILLSAQGREGGGEKRAIHNATRGSSSIEFTVDALYCAQQPVRTAEGLVVQFDCLKQREGAPLEFVVPIDEATGLIAEDGR